MSNQGTLVARLRGRLRQFLDSIANVVTVKDIWGWGVAFLRRAPRYPKVVVTTSAGHSTAIFWQSHAGTMRAKQSNASVGRAG